MKTEITKIKLQLKGRDIELTAAEAREVQSELNKLFEIEKTELQKFKEQWEKDNPKTSPFPWPSYPAPIIIERERVPYWPRPWEIWCGDVPMHSSGHTNCGTLCIAVGQVS